MEQPYRKKAPDRLANITREGKARMEEEEGKPINDGKNTGEQNLKKKTGILIFRQHRQNIRKRNKVNSFNSDSMTVEFIPL